MPAKTKAKVEGIDDVKKRLKDVQRNSYRKSTIVSAAKKSGDPIVKEMRANIRATEVGQANRLAMLVGKQKISRKYDGDEFPGAFIGPKSKRPQLNFPEKGPRRFLSLYFIEFGTVKRKTKSGRETGKMQAHAPMRNAIKATVRPANRNFVNRLIDKVNDQIKKNRL